MNYLQSRQVSLHVLGDKSGETYSGQFHVLERLNHRFELQKDRKYRELLGLNPQDASEDSKFRAEILAELSVAFTSVPDWFKDSAFGELLVDNNVVVKLYEETMKVRQSVITELQDKAKDATVELKKTLEVEKNK
jgi:hypothetical protein